MFSYYVPNIDREPVRHRKTADLKAEPGNGYAFSSKHAQNRAAQILKDVDLFLSSPLTNTRDGSVFRHLLGNRFVGPAGTGRASVVRQPNAQTVMVQEYGKSAPAFKALTENYDRIVEGLYNFKTKNIARKLMFQGIISGEEFQNILCKSYSREYPSASVLLDTLMTPSHVHRSSPERVVSAFATALKCENAALARQIYPREKDRSNL